MPIAYLKKVADERGIALSKLEEYWAKAKEIAKQNKDAVGEAYWRYTMGIFKNMASLNNVSVSEAYESISARVTKLKKPAKPKKPSKPGTKKSGAKKTVAKRANAKKEAEKKAFVKRAQAKRKVQAVKLPEWWVKKSELSKKKYIEKHPSSKFVKDAASKSPSLRKVLVQAQKKAGIPVDAPSAASSPSVPHKDTHKVTKQIKDMADKAKGAEEKKAAVTPVVKREDKKPEPIPAGGYSKKEKEEQQEAEQKTIQIKHKSIFHRAYFKARQKINHTLKRDKLGKHCVAKFLTGHKLTDNEHKHMMNWAGVAAKLVVGVAVGAAMFTPLAGLAPELGSHFLTLLTGGSSESSSSSTDSEHKGKIVPIGNPDKFEPTDFTDRLQHWLMEQDIPALVKKLKKEE